MHISQYICIQLLTLDILLTNKQLTLSILAIRQFSFYFFMAWCASLHFCGFYSLCVFLVLMLPLLFFCFFNLFLLFLPNQFRNYFRFIILCNILFIL